LSERNNYQHIAFNGIFYCCVCGKQTQSLSHLSDKYWGDAVECMNCHDYVIYLTPDNLIWKDEIYLNNLYVLRNLERQITTIYNDDKNTEIALIQGILLFKEIEELRKRIKTITVFS